MESINRANGCLVAIPDTHKAEHLEHDYPEWEINPKFGFS
jgi:phytanoyl-CoA hydroxylase